MNFKKIGMTLFLCLIIVVLLFVNIGLNISGPSRYEAYQDEKILETVRKKYPVVSELYRHSFKYVTYSYYNEKYVYIFDNEADLVVKREFDVSSLEKIQQYCLENYGLEGVEVHLGFGYDNICFVVEENDLMVLFDYDTKEVIYYLKGNLV